MFNIIVEYINKKLQRLPWASEPISVGRPEPFRSGTARMDFCRHTFWTARVAFCRPTFRSKLKKTYQFINVVDGVRRSHKTANMFLSFDSVA